MGVCEREWIDQYYNIWGELPVTITHRFLDAEDHADLFLIRWACLAPWNLPFCAEEGYDLRLWDPAAPGSEYVGTFVNGVYTGLFCLFGDGPVVEAHIAYLQCAYGHSIEIGKSQVEWVKRNTDIQELQSPCIDTNSLAKRLILGSGFKFMCKSDKKWKKDGEHMAMSIYNWKRGV